MKRMFLRGAAWPALALYTMLLACMFGLVVLGGGLYGHLAASQGHNTALRGQLSYLYARVRAADSAGGVSVQNGPEGPSLVLADPSAPEYVTRIYLYQGNLVEEYAPAANAPQPQQAQPIAKADTFAPALENGLLTIQTSQGTLRAALRTAQGG